MVNTFRQGDRDFVNSIAGNVVMGIQGSNYILEYISPRHNDLIERKVPLSEGPLSVVINLVLDGVDNLRNFCFSKNVKPLEDSFLKGIKRWHDYIMDRGGKNVASRLFMGDSLYHQGQFKFS